MARQFVREFCFLPFVVVHSHIVDVNELNAVRCWRPLLSSFKLVFNNAFYIFPSLLALELDDLNLLFIR